MDRKAIVTGSSGFVGSAIFLYLRRKGYDVLGVSRSASSTTTHILDLSDRNGAHDFLAQVKPDHVIHCAALPNVNYCETHEKESFALNVDLTRNLCDALDSSCTITFLSTDYVYDGRSGSYTEDSRVNPLNVYGKHKLLSEDIIKKHKRHLILRTTGILGYHPGGKNFLMQLLDAKTPIRIPYDQIGNPTPVSLLAETIYLCLLQSIFGTYILTGNQPLSRLDLSYKIADIFGVDSSLFIPSSTSSAGQTAPRPLNCALFPMKIQHELGVCFLPLDHHLRIERTKITQL